MKIKKIKRNIILIIIGVFAVLFFYGKHNFETDKQTLLELKSKAGIGEIGNVLDKMKAIKSLSNPLINFAYQKWKKKMYARFISKEEVFENTSGNKIINDLSNIYREYWRIELLKHNPENRTDSSLYNNITEYILTNQLTNLSKDSLQKTIKNDSELKRIIEKQGFKVDFKYRNGFQELFIWDKETTNKYEVILPNDTIYSTVVFIESYHINGYDNYASLGSSSVGGWAIKESATLYCNKSDYDLTSEHFTVSYLKHESLHFTDLNNYPNLSAADLEYRAKLIELMYCTEKTIYDRVIQFINGANSADRNHSHPYANHMLIKNLSKMIFNTEYESNYKKWKKIPVKKINEAATSLYKLSEAVLIKNHILAEII
jgi:hypothetical protein